MRDLEYDFEWEVAEDETYDTNNEDYCPYCGCELEFSILGMKCPNYNCEFGEILF